MHMNKKTTFTLLTTALGLAFAATPTIAADKAYSGALCQPLSGPVAYLPDGSVANLSPVPSAVLCPVTRNDPTTGSNMVSKATVWVVNPGPAADSVQCILHAEDNDSGAFALSSRASASIDADPQPLAFGGFGAGGGQGWSLNVSCLLPEQPPSGVPSAVKNLRIKES
jgi:hypothetical protein